jgi:hypothetical protein
MAVAQTGQPLVAVIDVRSVPDHGRLLAASPDILPWTASSAELLDAAPDVILPHRVKEWTAWFADDQGQRKGPV